LIIRNKLTNFI